MGLTREQIHQPLRRRRVVLERGRALQHRADAPGAVSKEGRRGGRRHAARILHHHRHRRHRHGPRGHEVLAGVARGHRRLASSSPCVATPTTPSVGLAGCDKSLPGIMMAMLRLNVPSVFIYGGSILPGQVQRPGRHGQSTCSRRVGKHSAGNMSDAELARARSASRVRAPAPAAAQFTANTMATVSEAIGLALPGSAGAPAPYESRDEFCVARGKAVMRAARATASARAISCTPQGVRERRDHRCRDPAARPTPACTCRPWRMRCGHRVRSVRGLRRSSSARPISPTSSPAARTSPRTCSRSAACRS